MASDYCGVSGECGIFSYLREKSVSQKNRNGLEVTPFIPLTPPAPILCRKRVVVIDGGKDRLMCMTVIASVVIINHPV